MGGCDTGTLSQKPKSQARTGIGWWMDFYDRRRPHSALNDRTPAEAYTDDGADWSLGLCPVPVSLRSLES